MRNIKFVTLLVLLLCSAVGFAMSNSQKQESKHSTYYDQRKTLFEVLPNTKGEIIFLGNSITDGGNWSELFHDLNVKNRGISGDVTDGVLDRLDEVVESKPAKIFIMIGVNDLARGKTVAYVVDNYKKIIERIRKNSPETTIYIQSVLPVNDHFTKFKNHVNKTDQIIAVNNHLKEMAQQFDKTSYIDLFSHFATEDNRLKPNYTNDGLHLTGKGYLLWKSLIEKYVEPRKSSSEVSWQESLRKKRKGTLVFTFASLAYTIDAPWGKGVPRRGMERLAGIAHKHGVPVTWLIDSGSGREMQSKINEWHEKYGDDIGVVWGHSHATPSAFRDGATELEKLKKLFPWSKVALAAAGSRSNEMLAAVKKAGVKGLWGSCWEQTEIDRITDRGAPWGFFYAADECYKIPSRVPGGVISVEWTTRDLCKSIHSHAPTIYSSDPDDVGRTGLCTGDDIEYWKGMFDNYLKNIQNNKYVFFPQHQEAHEIEYGEVCQAYSPEEIENSSKMLDAFFEYVSSFGDLVKFATIPEAMELYAQQSDTTMPSIMLVDDVPCRKPPFWYAKGKAIGPWPKTLLYYDKDCQVVFIDGQMAPILLRDYTHHRQPDDANCFQVMKIPQIKVDTPWERKEFTDIPLRIPYDGELPYAVAFWYDFNRFRLDHVEGARVIGPIQDQVLLLRKNLTPGENKIFIKLKACDTGKSDLK